MPTPPDHLTLASASPRRRDLLLEARLRFQVHPAAVEEFEDPQAAPDHLVLHNARLKAQAIASTRPEALILAADTTVYHRGHILNKPTDLADARATLRRLSGDTHEVFTAFTLYAPSLGLDEVHVERSQVRFHTLDEALITHYFSIVNPLDKAGSYGIQEGRDLIIADHAGSFTNIMGLPMEALLATLERLQLLPFLRHA